MKRSYTAPKVYFESFTMSTNIAGDCENFSSNATKGTCGVYDASINDFLFFSGISGCKVAMTDDTLCYDLPSPSENIFNS